MSDARLERLLRLADELLIECPDCGGQGVTECGRCDGASHGCLYCGSGAPMPCLTCGGSCEIERPRVCRDCGAVTNHTQADLDLWRERYGDACLRLVAVVCVHCKEDV